ncbi:uncharacterized protein TrAtP1_003628 [Trichoderma atroviride]|uniref:uncharacterized protein n=1 Tax=Hypocrea atroviridis TaxID=63577 RepID=UPI00331EA625|nr:hypothetical protein TrAtP1_003628 [Trichoderma atroviride]
MQSAMLRRAGAKGLRNCGCRTARASVATLAAFRPPTITNEPNQHYAKGSQQREGLTAAVEKLQQKLPLEVPVVVGGQQVR